MMPIARCTRAPVAIAALAATLVIAGGLAAPRDTTAAPSGDWKLLFNGHDFSGWVVPAGRGAAPGSPAQNPADVGWTIKDGVIVQEDFYADFVRESIEAGYKGYIGYELCHQLPKENGLTAGLEFAERNARLAVEYMEAIIDHVQLRVEPA